MRLGRRGALQLRCTTASPFSYGVSMYPMHAHGHVISHVIYADPVDDLARYSAAEKQLCKHSLTSGILGKTKFSTSGKNDRDQQPTHALARFSCGCARARCELIRAPSRGLEIGITIPELVLSLDDLFAAYRRVPTANQECMIAAMWDLDADEPVFCEVNGHCFGLISSVLNFKSLIACRTCSAWRRRCSSPCLTTITLTTISWSTWRVLRGQGS